MLLTDDELNARFKELQGVKIELDPDPVASGLPSINRKISELQGHKERVGALLIEAIKNRSEAEITLDSKRNEYNMRLESMLATDPDVQAQKSAEMQKAAANIKIKELVLEIAYMERDFSVADAYHKCVAQMYTNLEGANANLSRQISVVQMGLTIGEISRDNNLGSRTITTGR